MRALQASPPRILRHKKGTTPKGTTLFMVFTVSISVAAFLCFHSVAANGDILSSVYASQGDLSSQSDFTDEDGTVYEVGFQNSLSGIVDGVRSVKEYTNTKSDFDIEHSFENIIVGESIANKEAISKISVVNGIHNHTNVISQSAEEIVNEVQMTDKDYDTLCHIVEAEATGEGILGKILVANVILNRVDDSRFPNSVYGVVWEVNNEVAQFAPTIDGRIETVTVTEQTIEAVKRAINGEDYSKGALYFSAGEKMEPSELLWFDAELERLFTYGGHEFYTIKSE